MGKFNLVLAGLIAVLSSGANIAKASGDTQNILCKFDDGSIAASLKLNVSSQRVSGIIYYAEDAKGLYKAFPVATKVRMEELGGGTYNGVETEGFLPHVFVGDGSAVEAYAGRAKYDNFFVTLDLAEIDTPDLFTVPSFPAQANKFESRVTYEATDADYYDCITNRDPSDCTRYPKPFSVQYNVICAAN